ncbi:MAG TPA: hypothetical protein DEQ02_01775 [Ruminococcaceae bacterium]|nr:hypothetical protein [Oscillospiraceae bacterium]
MKNIVLSIIVPYYKEKPDEIFPLLASINSQMSLDFEKIECVLVNDGAQNKLDDAFLSTFKNLNARCIVMDENRGPGMARQMGIDHAAGEYVMFCDADDVLHNENVLRAFLETIEGKHPDMFCSSWYEEHIEPDTGKISYILHYSEYTWLHGKVFRRAFLEENNIRFHQKLRVHEDTHFLSVAAMEGQMLRIGAISYIWKYNKNSITRKDNFAYFIKSTIEHIKSAIYTCEAAETRHPERLGYVAGEFIIYYYFHLHEPKWRYPENKEYLFQSESALRSLIKKYAKHFKALPTEIFTFLYTRQQAMQPESDQSTETLDEWLKRLSKGKNMGY